MKISRDPFAKRGLKLVINTIFPRSKILSPSYPPLLLPHLSLSLPFSLHIPPSRSPARSFALVPSHFPAFSLSSMTSFSRSHRLAYTQLFLSHHTSENPVSKRENGWTTCTRFKTNTTNLRVTLAGRYYVLSQLPPPPFPRPSSIRGTFRSLGDENDEFSQLWNSYPTSERTFYIVTLNALTNEYFIADDYFCIFISL